jgi:hypothetical protein
LPSFSGTVGGTVSFDGITTNATVGFDTSIGIVYIIIHFQYQDSNLNAVVDLTYTAACTNKMKASGKILSYSQKLILNDTNNTQDLEK